MTIKEIEARTGLPRASVRYYEAEGLIHPARGRNGYRDYSPQDEVTLEKIALLRELECSLEDIRALQRGTKTLGEVARERLAALEGQGERLERAREICRSLLDRGVSYAGLEPRSCGGGAAAPAPKSWTPPEQAGWDYRFDCPWRRLLARYLDLTLCRALFFLFRGVALGMSNLRRGPGDGALCAAAAMGLMLLLEPLFLHLFSTTPGKWAFGLRVTRGDGSSLGYGEALARTVKVLVCGLGLTIPLAELVALLLAYLRNRRGEEQPWEGWDERYEDRTRGRWGEGGRWLRGVAAWAAVLALGAGAVAGGEYLAARPPHREAETAEEFVENYNHLLGYLASPDVPVWTLDGGGGWQRRETPGTAALTEGQIKAQVGRPDFSLKEDGQGRLEEVSFRYDPALDGEVLVYVPMSQVLYAACALEGQGIVVGPGEDDANSWLEEPLADRPGVYTLDTENWQVEYTFRFRGGEYVAGMEALVPQPGGTCSVTLAFTARRK